jgi:nitronate monooxygenase
VRWQGKGLWVLFLRWGTGYRFPELVKRDKFGRPIGSIYIHSKEALTLMIQKAKEISQGRGAIGVNILYAITDYGRVLRDAIEAGADAIITGAGLPLKMPEYAEGCGCCPYSHSFFRKGS